MVKAELGLLLLWKGRRKGREDNDTDDAWYRTVRVIYLFSNGLIDRSHRTEVK